MRIHVAIATRGRAAEVATLLTWLDRNTRRPDSTTIVGAGDADVAGITDAPDVERPVHVTIGARPGLTAQRNHALAVIRRCHGIDADDLVVFFDDDFRPDIDWLAQAEVMMMANPGIIGLTGRVLLDGARGPAISEAAADAAIAAARLMPQRQDTALHDVHGLYGCNMAIRGAAFDHHAFDERLPLYSWGEDLDFSGRIRSMGRIVETANCRGVHLASKSGRVSGVRFGYSQIVNPIYLARKPSCSRRRAGFMVARALGSNLLRSFRQHPLFDYRGRLQGNLIAVGDILRGRGIDPEANARL